mmetsp:Transcript_12617/g.36403  ORF Transcript_12617/g.36403 Transcript_12617/m.36403 type:complete len:119 (-) Transcript_12617:242-598(-)
MMNVAGGLLVAITIKYADNIVRGFAQAVAIIVSSVASYFLFDFQITPTFVFGVCLVGLAILLYGNALPIDCCTSWCPDADAAERKSLVGADSAEKSSNDAHQSSSRDSPPLSRPDQHV